MPNLPAGNDPPGQTQNSKTADSPVLGSDLSETKICLGFMILSPEFPASSIRCVLFPDLITKKSIIR